jgi:RNA polymerase sigma factor (sigma-70 family)
MKGKGKKRREIASMTTPLSPDRDLETLLARFTNFIRAHIQKFEVQRFGIDPDDIAQEVRIKIWKLIKNEKNVVNYASYIKKIVDSVVIDQLRLLRKDEQLYRMEKQKQVAEQLNGYRPEVLRNTLLKEAVGKAVESLIESRRNVVKLYLFDLNIEEISRFYGWSLHKTRNLLYRGLADLKRSLKKADIGNGHER